MAHYQGTFKDNTDNLYQVQIIDAADSGTVYSEFTVGDGGFTLDYSGDEDDRFSPIITSQISFGFMVADAAMETYLQTIADADYGSYFVRVYKSTELYWVGIVDMENFVREDIYYPYVHEITANDGITKLENVDYMDGEELYSGYNNFTNAVLDLLSHIGTHTLWGVNDRYLVSCVDWYDAEHGSATPTIDPLKYTQFNQSVLYFQEDLTGIDIENNDVKMKFALEQMISRWGARIFQANGTFWIIPFNVYKSVTNVWWHSYNYDGGLLSHSYSNVMRYSAQVLAGGTHQHMPRLKAAIEKYNIMGSVNFWRSDKNLSTEWPVFDVVAGESVWVSFDVVSKFTPPSGYNAGLIPVVQVEARCDNNYYLVGKFVAGGKPMVMTTTPPQTSGKFWDYWVKADTSWISGTGLNQAANYKVFNINLNLQAVGMNGTFYIKASVIGYIYVNEVSNFPKDTSEPAPFNRYVHPLPSGWSHVYSFKNETVMKVVGVNLENDVQTFKASIAGSNNKGYVYEHPDMVIGSVYSTINPGMKAYDGVAWKGAFKWGYRSVSGTDQISYLNMKEIMRGQITPTEVYYGAFIGDTTFENALLRGSKIMIPAECSYNAAMQEWEGSWFVEDNEELTLLTDDSYTYNSIGPATIPGGPIQGQSPVSSSATMNYLQQSAALVTTTAQVSGITGLISTTEVLYSGTIITDDVLKIFDPITGAWDTMIVIADVAVGDTSIQITSKTFNNVYPPGSAIVMDTQFLLSKTR